jgi:hypothetical protein
MPAEPRALATPASFGSDDLVDVAVRGAEVLPHLSAGKCSRVATTYAAAVLIDGT